MKIAAVALMSGVFLAAVSFNCAHADDNAQLIKEFSEASAKLDAEIERLTKKLEKKEKATTQAIEAAESGPKKEFARFAKMVNVALQSMQRCRNKYGDYDLPCASEQKYRMVDMADDYIDQMTNFFGSQNDESKARYGDVADYKRTESAMESLKCDRLYYTTLAVPHYFFYDKNCVDPMIDAVRATLDK